ncbi:peptidoglycan-binding domain-containing protein [Bacillus sp. DJP31]|uniref:peptidoglycan-binding domain-containing protein n=1 Tax=Bacillus sp. DJP31 TaxID=3409789 RepID=UPI003BB5B331
MSDVKETYQTIFVEGQDTGVVVVETPPAPAVKGVTVSLPLREGDNGEFVREVQQDLIQAGFPLPRYGADGRFGSETEVAVMRFQRRYGLRVDGLVGPLTLDKLNEVLGSSNPRNEFPLPEKTLRFGDTGEDVKQLQRALQQINFDPKFIDGSYGPLTEDAVRRFQSTYAALADDGIYGPNTRRYLQMELADQN